jgi:Ran-binding protein 3
MVDAIKDTNDDDDDNNKESGNINSTILTFRGGQSSPSLPEVEMVTGEEGERHVVQITCKLFAFDKANRTWKEKGRGEVRLNDSPQSEGVFQSRLIMRASGNYRVLLNTNLWCKMTCEKASPQSFRLTAQETDGQFGIYLIKGASKDIHHLYSAIDQRLQALHKLSKESASTSPSNEPHLPKDKTPHPPGSYDEDDSVLGDRACLNSSPDSSPDHKRFQERLGEPSSTPSPYYPEQNFNNQTTTDPFTGTSESSQVAIVTPLTDGDSSRPTSDNS